MDILIKLGIIIKEERIKKGISQEKLANLADIDRTYLPSIEKGERNISVQILFKIAKALGSTPSELLKDIKL